MSEGKLTGKVAIVTGAAQGMGRCIAEALSNNGAQVACCDLKEVAVKEFADTINGLGIKVDVTKENNVQELVKKTVETYGTVDILVNNAGILRPTQIDNITKEEWDLVLDVNLNGTFLCSKAVLPIMKKKNYGRIVNISSSAGRSVSTLGGAHYTTAKAGVLGFTRAVAKELGNYGITANAVCPGLIDTEMVRIECSDERIKAYEKSFPVSRLGTVEEVARLVLFIVADAPYITGASIDINGGDLMM